jgi:methionyl-tRNA formyltransferase
VPQRILDIPARGWVNLHFSVLPAWRGAAPVQHAILRGDDITGATTFQLVKEMDAGPVYGTLTEPIRPTDTSGDLLERLAVSGAQLMVATLDGIEDGTLRAVPQPADGISFTTKLTPDDARVDWKLPAHVIDRKIRACTPDPAAWSLYRPGGRPPVPPDVRAGGHDRKERELIMPASADEGLSAPLGVRAAERLKLWPVTMAAGAGVISGGASLAPGEFLVDRNAVYAGTGTISVRLGDVQPQGKRRMAAADWARGLHADPGTRVSFE